MTSLVINILLPSMLSNATSHDSPNQREPLLSKNKCTKLLSPLRLPKSRLSHSSSPSSNAIPRLELPYMFPTPHVDLPLSTPQEPTRALYNTAPLSPISEATISSRPLQTSIPPITTPKSPKSPRIASSRGLRLHDKIQVSQDRRKSRELRNLPGELLESISDAYPLNNNVIQAAVVPRGAIMHSEQGGSNLYMYRSSSSVNHSGRHLQSSHTRDSQASTVRRATTSQPHRNSRLSMIDYLQVPGAWPGGQFNPNQPRDQHQSDSLQDLSLFDPPNVQRDSWLYQNNDSPPSQTIKPSIPHRNETTATSSASTIISTLTKTCVVCNEAKSTLDFPIRPTSHCTHSSKTCFNCFQEWISSRLENFGLSNITCPECPEKLDYTDMKNFATPGVFSRYDTLATRALLSDLPEFTWCLNPSCNSGQIHSAPSSNPIFRCVSCSQSYCLNHKITWHTGETCEAYERRTNKSYRCSKMVQEEIASEVAIQQTSKKCPGQTCGWRIEKNDGCDHMTCSKCKHEFCWICLAPYDPIRKLGNSKHMRHCKWYA